MAGSRWTESHPRRRGEAWVKREGIETAVFNPDTGVLHLINAPALAIWELCDGETTPEEMADAISELTALDEETSLADVHLALESLYAAGLLTV